MSDKLISADNLLEAGKNTSEFQQHLASVYDLECLVMGAPAVDAVEVVRCKECRWAKSYERCDGEIGFYCHFCGHSFTYGERWERLFTPIKEKDDFCSYGERREENAVD